jgi:hypothetical protein
MGVGVFIIGAGVLEEAGSDVAGIPPSEVGG